MILMLLNLKLLKKFKHAVARVPDLFKQVVGPLALVPRAVPSLQYHMGLFSRTLAICDSYLDFPEIRGQRDQSHHRPSIWPRPADPPLDFSKNFCYNKRKNTDWWRRRLENLKNFCYNIIIIKKGKNLLWNFMKR